MSQYSVTSGGAGDFRYPPPLQPGDRLRVIAPSGALRELESFNQGLEVWRSWGFGVDVSPGVREQWGYLAGADDNRRHQLGSALADPTYKGILCARGGYGGTRLLEGWQWPEVLAPKWLIGFSDITSLLWSLGCRGMVGVHGPLLTTLATEPDWSQQRLKSLVTGHGLLPLHGEGWGGGTVTGRLWPANLTVATHLLGTAHAPDLTGAIVAFEDVTEAPYRIDRMLTHWRMAGKLVGVKGIALGRFSRCEPPDGVPSLTVAEVLRDRLGDLGIPVVSGLPFGHDGDNAALPVGSLARLNGDTGSLEILSAA
ncbi:LD-carboxypeptidase [Nodosilinea sp. E11]|uniref:S66 peptidase family protein n=1 Tax=Nodosilinea sp. E11 TaxID=3037479 RepID=UPI002934ADCD|nr:LD-carboxypeptidase [Nodosilinea sp. E11]WOD39329.1 LD-carboxypeptidase [Nodosilinea sp. E11]